MAVCNRLQKVFFWALLGCLLTWATNRAHGQPLPVPDYQAPSMTTDPVGYLSKVIRCQVQQQGDRGLTARADHYTERKINVYAGALLAAARSQTWPRIKVRTTDEQRAAGAKRWTWYALNDADAAFALASIVRQQSLWVPTSVSRWNKGPDGEYIDPGPKPWRRPNGDLDYGLVQLHWGTLHRWAGRRVAFRDLADPTINLELGALWLYKRADRCATYLNGKRPKCKCSTRRMARGKWWTVRKQCPKSESESIACRCLANWRAGGFPVFTGKKSSWSLAGKYAPLTRQCFQSPDNTGPDVAINP